LIDTRILDDLELLQVRIFGESRRISQILEATTAKRMKILFNIVIMFLAMICRNFFARGLHTRIAVARLP